MLALTNDNATAAGYRLLGPVYRGGSAFVYKACSLSTGQMVSLKLLHDAQDSKPLIQESKVLQSLQHTNIVEFVELIELAGEYCLVTVWFDGKPLSSHSPIPCQHPDKHNEDHLDNILTRSLALCKQLATALQYAHDKAIVHGDLSPSNIIVNHLNELQLIDFGTSKLAQGTTETAVGHLAGTLMYLSPEVIQGHRSTALSDQYAFALIVYQMLSGRWAFAQQIEQSVTAATALHHQLYSEPVPLSEHYPDIPSAVDDVLSKALQKLPQHRYCCISDFMSALEQSFDLEFSDSNGKNRPVNAFNLSPRQKFGQQARRSYISRYSAIPLSTLMAIAPLIAGMLLLPMLAWAPVFEQSSDTHSVANGSPAPALTEQHRFCNQFDNTDFDIALEKNFYQDIDNQNMATIVSFPAMQTSPVLQLGGIDTYGSYGIIIDVLPQQRYSFGATLHFDGYVHKAHLAIHWLDNNWQLIDEQEARLEIDEKFNGPYFLSSIPVPEGAHYAVPTVFKDASVGIVYVDDVFFTVNEPHCKASG